MHELRPVFGFLSASFRPRLRELTSSRGSAGSATKCGVEISNMRLKATSHDVL
jgi:hypothetical protein